MIDTWDYDGTKVIPDKSFDVYLEFLDVVKKRELSAKEYIILLEAALYAARYEVKETSLFKEVSAEGLK